MTDTRIHRGIALYNKRGMEIVQDGDSFRVPGSGSAVYTVRLGDTPYCSCPDRTPEGDTDKHVIAATIYAAKHQRRVVAKPESLRGVDAALDVLDRMAG